MTILEEAYHSLIFIEHDPMLYEDDREMTGYVSLALREAAQRGCYTALCAGADPYLEELVKNADRVLPRRRAEG